MSRIKLNKVFFANYFSLSEIKKNNEVTGRTFSVTDLVKQYLAVMLFIYIVGKIFELDIFYITLVCVSMLLFIPGIIKTQMKSKYEERRFLELITYMEQILFSFKRTPKILWGMKNALPHLKNETYTKVKEAIDYIEAGFCENDIYKEAFKIIEDEFGSERLVTIHKFLYTVETQGQEYKDALNALLYDLEQYTLRTKKIQKEKNGKKNSFVVAMITTLSINLFMVKMLSSYNTFNLVDSPIYQISTLLIFVLFEFGYFSLVKRLTSSWFISDRSDDNLVITKTYYNYKNYDFNKAKRNSNIIWIIGLVLFVLGFFLENNIIVIIGLISFIFSTIKTDLILNLNKKSIETELTRVFPNWLRVLSTYLQFQSVRTAIISSYESAPSIMKPALEVLIEDLNKDPHSMGPYDRFLKEFDIPEIHQTMTLLNSLNDVEKSSVQQKINDIIKGNIDLSVKSEELKNNILIQKAALFTKFPDALMVFKMAVDMLIVLNSFMATTGSVGF